MNQQAEILEGGTPPRPTLTGAMREEAVRKTIAAHPVLFSDDIDSDAVESGIATLVKELRFHDDGFELAKAVERDWWNVDAEVVEILDGLSETADNILREAVKYWVSEFDVMPVFSPGTRVTWKQNGKQVAGVICAHEIQFYYAQAFYKIREDGRKYPGNGDGGTIVAYELCTAEQVD